MVWRAYTPAWNRSELPLPSPLATPKLVPPPPSAKPTSVFGDI